MISRRFTKHLCHEVEGIFNKILSRFSKLSIQKETETEIVFKLVKIDLTKSILTAWHVLHCVVSSTRISMGSMTARSAWLYIRVKLAASLAGLALKSKNWERLVFVTLPSDAHPCLQTIHKTNNSIMPTELD